MVSSRQVVANRSVVGISSACSCALLPRPPILRAQPTPTTTGALTSGRFHALRHSRRSAQQEQVLGRRRALRQRRRLRIHQAARQRGRREAPSARKRGRCRRGRYRRCGGRGGGSGGAGAAIGLAAATAAVAAAVERGALLDELGRDQPLLRRADRERPPPEEEAPRRRRRIEVPRAVLRATLSPLHSRSEGEQSLRGTLPFDPTCTTCLPVTL